MYERRSIDLPYLTSSRKMHLYLGLLNLHKCGDGEGYEAERHDEPEETLIANVFGDETRHHAGNHHAAQILTRGADGEDGCGAFATGESDEIEGVGSKAKSIANLLDTNTGADEPEVVGGEITEIDIDDVRQRDAEDKRPKAFLQAPFRYDPSTDDATEEKTDDTQSAIDETKIHIAHAKSSFGGAAGEEEGDYFGEESFGQTKQEDEAEG